MHVCDRGVECDMIGSLLWHEPSHVPIKRDDCIGCPPNPTFGEKGEPVQILSRACARVAECKDTYRHIQVLAHTSFFSLEMWPLEISMSVGSCAADARGRAGSLKVTLGSWKCVWHVCLHVCHVVVGIYYRLRVRTCRFVACVFECLRAMSLWGINKVACECVGGNLQAATTSSMQILGLFKPLFHQRF